MVRRALRKRIPLVDMTGTMHELSEMSPPWVPEHFFDHAGELVVEIGSGKGLFLLNAAPARPGHLFVGVEMAQPYAELVAARSVQRGLDNVRIVRGDGNLFLSNFVADSAVAEVHVYFPDPWWKKRHRRRRLMQSSFVRSVERVLQSGGRFHFWTDVEDYFRFALQLLASETGLVGPYEVAELPAAHDMDFRTHFERRVRANHLPVFRAEFEKTA